MRMHTVRAATNLQKLGCEPGDIICIIAKNSHFVAPIGTYEKKSKILIETLK